MTYTRLDRVTKDHYTLNEIERALKNRELMYSYAMLGDLDIIHSIVDADTALRLAKPTEIQSKTMDLVWVKGLSLVETGRLLGVTPQAVKFNLDLLRVKLKKVIDAWEVSELRREGDLNG